MILATAFLILAIVLLAFTIPTLWNIRGVLRGRERLATAREAVEWLFWLTLLLVFGTFIIIIVIYILWLTRVITDRMAGVLMIILAALFTLTILILFAILFAAISGINGIQGNSLLFRVATRIAEPRIVAAFDSIIQILVFEGFAAFFGIVALVVFLL